MREDKQRALDVARFAQRRQQVEQVVGAVVHLHHHHHRFARRRQVEPEKKLSSNVSNEPTLGLGKSAAKQTQSHDSKYVLTTNDLSRSRKLAAPVLCLCSVRSRSIDSSSFSLRSFQHNPKTVQRKITHLSRLWIFCSRLICAINSLMNVALSGLMG